jgi:hypothetical protein
VGESGEEGGGRRWRSRRDERKSRHSCRAGGGGTHISALRRWEGAGLALWREGPPVRVLIRGGVLRSKGNDPKGIIL